MTTELMVDAIQGLLDSLLLLKPGLRNFDEARPYNDNIEITGVEKQFVRPYLLGLRAIGVYTEHAAQVDRDTAGKLMACYARVGAPLSDAEAIIRKLPEEGRHALLYPLVEMMADIWFKLQLPVVRQHPDLDPDGDRYRRKTPPDPS